MQTGTSTKSVNGPLGRRSTLPKLTEVSLNLTQYEPIDSSDVVLPPAVEVHPWQRYWARRIDYWIFAVLGGGLLGFSGFFPDGETRGLDLMLEIGFVSAWIPCEAAFLALYGATPGKMLFGIGVRATNGHLLSFGAALKRSVWVAAAGVGLGIPLFGLIGSWRGWRMLTDSGTTLWDEPEGHVVTHQGFQWWHLGATLFALLLIAVLLYVNGTLLLPFIDSLRPDGPGLSDEG